MKRGEHGSRWRPDAGAVPGRGMVGLMVKLLRGSSLNKCQEKGVMRALDAKAQG
jgi:hypothetical protein